MCRSALAVVTGMLVLNRPPGTPSRDTTSVSDGERTVTVQVTDSTGTTATPSTKVAVDN